MTDGRIKDSPKPVYEINRNRSDVYKNTSMAKSKSIEITESRNAKDLGVSGAYGKNEKYDPALVSLFARSFGAVKIAAKSTPHSGDHDTAVKVLEVSGSSNNTDSEENGILSETSTERVHTSTSHTGDTKESIFGNNAAKSSNQKRKRNDTEDDLESRYMTHLSLRDIQENQNRVRSLQHEFSQIDPRAAMNEDIEVLNEDREPTSDPNMAHGCESNFAVRDAPQHECYETSNEDLGLEKSSRTVFLANVSTMAIKFKNAKKTLMNHLISFTSSLPGEHKIESVRFRSTAFAISGIPKKASFVKKEVMDATTKSTNAYVVYTTKLAAREAVTRLNGSVVLDRHLRVDCVASPAEIDHRRCVFVGNLGFVDVDTNIKAAKGKGNNDPPRRAKEPADVEEGLWRQFEKAGTVESVRVVRDKQTRVGKGFAYVQFKDANSVEKALLYHEKKFPPMLPRTLRVIRAKNMKRSTNRKKKPFSRNAESSKDVPSQVQLLTDRAHELLGRAGGSNSNGLHKYRFANSSGGTRSSQPLVFEGFRASRSQGKGARNSTGRKRSKPSTRSKEFKERGRKKKTNK